MTMTNEGSDDAVRTAISPSGAAALQRLQKTEAKPDMPRNADALQDGDVADHPEPPLQPQRNDSTSSASAEQQQANNLQSQDSISSPPYTLRRRFGSGASAEYKPISGENILLGDHLEIDQDPQPPLSPTTAPATAKHVQFSPLLHSHSAPSFEQTDTTVPPDFPVSQGPAAEKETADGEDFSGTETQPDDRTCR
jgi:hypothetical protein